MTTNEQNHRCELNDAIDEPVGAQRVVLAGILKAAADTTPGLGFGFAGIGSEDEFRAAVSWSRYHSVRPMIELQRASGDAVMTPGGVAGYAAGRAGDADAGKLPVGRADVEAHRRNVRLTAECLANQSGLAAGQVLDLSPLGELPLPEGFTASMQAVKSDAAAGWPDVSAVRDGEVRAYLLALLALSSPSVSGILAPDLRAIAAFEAVLRLHGEHLIRDIEARTVRVSDRIERELAEAVRERILPARGRVAELEAAHRSPQGLCVATAFPMLNAVATDGSLTPPPDTFLRIPESVTLLDIGCWMPAGCLGIPHDEAAEGEGLLPALLDVWFEFAAPGSQTTVGLAELEEGIEYAVFVTNRSGLYRYRVGVTARVTGRIRQCPLLTFRRTRGCDEHAGGFAPGRNEATAAARAALQDLGLTVPFIRMSRGAVDCDFVLTLGEGATGGVCPSHLSAAFDRRLRKASLRYDRLRELGHARVLEVRVSGAHQARQQQEAGDPQPCYAA
ncbi:MAG: GH3 auxin-responsive promoter family protein [Minwuia sp.]|uniref:GH3 family domain-containing protein n=1 Tax=Minwuia sp. TaxID=2493630 RepID=UPI003A863594